MRTLISWFLLATGALCGSILLLAGFTPVVDPSFAMWAGLVVCGAGGLLAGGLNANALKVAAMYCAVEGLTALIGGLAGASGMIPIHAEIVLLILAPMLLVCAGMFGFAADRIGRVPGGQDF